jgi:hypothetical protein
MLYPFKNFNDRCLKYKLSSTIWVKQDELDAALLSESLEM